MKKLFSTKKRIAIVASVAVVALTGVAAFAYFTTTGSGTGSAAVGTSTTWTVTADAYSGGPLTPGGGALTYESVAYKVNNPSSGQQSFTNVAISVAGPTGTAYTTTFANGKPECTNNDFQLSTDGGTTWGAAGATRNDTALASNVAPNSSTAQSTVMIRMVDTLANQDNCKTASVPLYFYVS